MASLGHKMFTDDLLPIHLKPGVDIVPTISTIMYMHTRALYISTKRILSNSYDARCILLNNVRDHCIDEICRRMFDL